MFMEQDQERTQLMAALGVFMRQKIANKNFTVVGDGKQKRDFIHVKDVCDAIIKATFSKQKNQIYNVGLLKIN